MMRAGRLALLALVAMLSVVACTSTQRPSVQADTVALPTPLRSYDASMAATIGRLQDAVTSAGSRLVVANSAYRPSEPEQLLQVPRVVMRADLAEADEGYVVIYEAADAAVAEALATEMARYLGSGFGRSNFAGDTQFSVAVIGDTVVFTSWSRSRAGDPERAEAAFDAVASVGTGVEVR